MAATGGALRHWDWYRPQNDREDEAHAFREGTFRSACERFTWTAKAQPVREAGPAVCSPCASVVRAAATRALEELAALQPPAGGIDQFWAEDR